MLKHTFLIIAIGYTIVLAIVSLISLNNIPSIHIENGDKLMHVLAYAMLALLWNFALKDSTFKYTLLVVIFLSIIYGIILEVIQGRLGTDRTSDIIDIIANCIGVALAALLILIGKRS